MKGRVWRSRVLTAACAVALALVGSAAAGNTAEAATATGTTVLKACHHVTHLERDPTHSLFDAGDFTLQLNGDLLGIDQATAVPGSKGSYSVQLWTWVRTDPHGVHKNYRDATVLSLSCTGDITLRHSTGALLWHSKTSGLGGKRLALLPSGILALYDASGHIVWRSGTTARLMATDHRLWPGQSLSASTADNTSVNRKLLMQPNGNLVYLWGSKVLWQSHTHVAGSHFTFTKNAQLGVVSPSGHVLWRSTSRIGPRGSLLDVENMRITEYYPKQALVWQLSGVPWIVF